MTNGHIQATGRDARRRKQYRYHIAWTAARGEAKYDRMIAFGEALPRLRRQIHRDLREPPLSQTRVLGTVVQLMERTLIRVGNTEYARTNHSYGLTTLRNRHLQIRGSTLAFKFRAKSGVLQEIELDDPMLARSVKRIQELPGQTLFQYVDAAGETQRIDSSDVNGYLQAIAGIDFTAKDFRTWFGTVLAATALREIAAAHPEDDSPAARNTHIVSAIDQVKSALGNTRAVCRRCYVHPAIMDAFLEGETIPATTLAGGNRRGSYRTAAERATLALLRRRRNGKIKKAA
jgi:DNA topoisomerase I